MLHEDQKYIKALLNNDSQVVSQIYSKFSKKINNYIVANSGSEEEASDIFQEALISIFKRASKGDFKLTCPFGAYLFMVCRSKWLNVLKSSKKKKETNFDPGGYNDIMNTEMVSDTLLYEDRMTFLESKLENLAEGCRSILKISWTGLSMQEVSKKLNISYAYARKKKSECIAKLIGMIKEDPNHKNLLS